MTNVISNNSICYEGKVDLYIIKKDKEIHLTTLNEGLIGISELFTRSCLGYPTTDYRPWYVDMRTEGGQSMLYAVAEVRATSFDSLSGQTGADAYLNGWKYPVFDALITTENLIDIQNGTCYFYLLSKNMTPLARVAIQVDAGALDNENSEIPTLRLRGGNNILVRWSMYLSNRTKEDNE